MRIFVTGAARGLGAALMEEGIRRGHKMAGGVRVLHGEGPEGLILPMDVTDGGQVKQAAAALGSALECAGCAHQQRRRDSAGF